MYKESGWQCNLVFCTKFAPDFTGSAGVATLLHQNIYFYYASYGYTVLKKYYNISKQKPPSKRLYRPVFDVHPRGVNGQQPLGHSH